MLLDEVDVSSPLRGDLEEIRKAGQRAESLTRQLLAFSRKQIAVLKVFDVKALFQIWLPSVTEPVSVAQTSETPVPAKPGGGETILVVEDDKTVRRLACKVLRRQGYQILEAPNGDEALRVAAETTARIDLLLTDGVMPGIAVGQLISRLREARPETHILIMSGDTNEVIVRRGILESDIPFLQKPCTSQMLLQKVRDVMDRRAEP